MATQDELLQTITASKAKIAELEDTVQKQIEDRSDLNQEYSAIKNRMYDVNQLLKTASVTSSEYYSLTNEMYSLISRESSVGTKLTSARAATTALQNTINEEQRLLERAERSLAGLAQESTVKTTETTNVSMSDSETTEKYATSGVVSNTTDNGGSTGTVGAESGTMSVKAFLNVSKAFETKSFRNAPSTESKKITPAYPTVNEKVDRRVRIKVPSSYLVGQAAGPNNELTINGGIVFPYTPDIKIENSASYSAVNVPHSNYTQYFYKNSSVGEIVITGKFTVQNETEAGIFLATVHLLRALTKMKFSDDQNAGAPPPVCRLFAYGNYVYDNTPVAVKQVSIQLPQDVDYIDAGKVAKFYGNSMAPTVSTITVALIPIYSRKEMLEASVTGWLTKDQRSKGFI